MENGSPKDPNQEERDRMLWKTAKRRVGFRSHLFTYIIVNGFLWGLWFFSGMKEHGRPGVPWPVWPMLGWGIGLLFDYIGAYHSTGPDAVEREYEKMKNKNK